jgi:methionine-rich copper-binding protein CopC
MKLKRLPTLVGVTALALLTTAFAMHLRLVKSAPQSGEVVSTIPTEIRLWFSQKPEVSLTSIKLLREDSTAIEAGKVARTDDSLSVKIPLSSALLPGTYIVTWRSVSKDGHAVRGSYRFNMAAAPPAHNY